MKQKLTYFFVQKLNTFLILLVIFTGTVVKAQSPAGDVVGKITVGYQGWFAAPGDGSPYNNWWHWTSTGGAPSSTNTGIKAWPDSREYATTFPTAYSNLPNGNPGNLFSSYTDQTINTQFLWMHQNGIDCAALQRFDPVGGEGPIRDAVTAKVKTAAETNSVKFYIMYDVSGWMNMQTEMKADWTNKMSVYTSSSAYAKQNGKPVVCIWGMGLNDTNHPFSSAVCVDVINWFKSQGCYVIGGVRGEWRTVNDGYMNTYNAFNMITPWLIGKIGDIAGEDNYYNNVSIGDQAYCNANGIDYQATILPGDLKEHQRVHGDFMWRQFYNMKKLGAQGIYISMYDEYNEGNQIAKTAENASQMPVNSGYFGLDEDGTPVSSDYYLRLTNDGGKMFKGQIALTATRPTPYFVNVAPGITNLTTAGGVAGTYLSYNIAASGGPTSFNATGLPTGLSVNTATGIITGIPTTAGNYTTTLSATNAYGTGSLAVTFNITTPPPESAYGGTPWPIPGKIEAENFDIGGQGVAYSDSDPANTGGQYRTTEGVDIEGCSDAGGGYDIGFTNAGEWLKYTVNVVTTGTYTFQARLATQGTGNTFHVEVDGYNISGSITVPNSGGWQTWEAVSFTTPTISSGQHVIRFYEETGGYNINNYNFILVAAAPVLSGAATATATTGTAFSYTITASNTPTSYGATGLPAGLSVNTSTGVISGTPTTAGTYTTSVSATNAGGTGTKTVTITVNSNVAAPVVSSAASAIGTVGMAFSYTITASNTPTSYSATGLPAGLSVNTSTGLITGTPTITGAYTATVSATNAGGTGSKTVAITIQNQGTGGMPNNPFVTSIYTADPSAHVWADGRLYVYPSHDIAPPRGCDLMDKYHVFSTADMVNWVDHGEILNASQVPWGRAEGGFMWAPDCAYKNGTYYFYFPHPSATDWGTSWKIGVATSSSPASGFTVQGYIPGLESLIDPCVFVDDDGQAYFYYGGGGTCKGGKLDATMMAINGTMQSMQGLFDFHEATWVHKKNGLYYLSYSDNNTVGGNRLRYATSTSPLGPWTAQGVYVDTTGSATDHGSIVDYKGQSYAFYHNSALSRGNDWIRSICVDKLYYNADGTIQKVIQTKGHGTPYGGTAHAIPGTIQLEDYDVGGMMLAYADDSVNTGGQYRPNEWVDIENCSEGGYDVGFTNAKEWMEYTVNVATAGTYTINLRAASGNTGGVVQLKNTAGVVLATLTVAGTGGWQTWSTVTATVNLPAGNQILQLYLVTGGYNLNWIQFVKASSAPVISSAGTAAGMTGQAFSYQITASDSPTSYGATGLPAGLSVNTSTGLISGTPTTAGTYNTTVSATNATGTGTNALIITIAQPAPVVSSAATATGTTGAAFTYNITASNTPTSYGATGLPAGLTVNTSTGVISGTPTTAGTYTTTVSATNSGGTGTKVITITINPTVTEAPYGGTPASIPGKIEAENYDLGGQGVAYNDNDAVNNGGQYRTTEGVDVESTGDIGAGYDIGFTNTGEWMKYTVNVTTTGTYTLQVRVASPGTGNSLHVELDGVNISGSIVVPNTAGWQTYQTVSVTTPSITSGQHLLRIYEETGGFNINYINFIAIPATPVVSSAGTASGNVGTTFSYTITASNTPTSYGATGLPAGLSVNTLTGIISGTPTASGTYTATVSATNAGGTGSKSVTISITPSAPVISSPATATGTTGTAFTYSITASNNPTSYAATGLPAGLSVNGSTGVISGTPTTAGTYTTTLSAVNAGGIGTKTVTMTISNPAGSTPYGGTAWPIPGKIEAENYDNGGQGIAYNDNDAVNSGGQYRTTEGVDVESTGDIGAGYDIGFTNAGEWMKYSVNVATTGVYTLQVRVASPGTGNSLHVELDGANISGSIVVPNTTGWQTYQTVSVTTPSLTAGLHVVRIYEETGGFNINYINFVNGTVAAPAISSATTANATLGAAFSYNITATNSPTSYGATGLPAGLSLNTSTGVISGTPINSGTSAVTISATNAGGTGSATLTLTVNPATDGAGVITCYKATTAITVNGSLSEAGWNLNKSISKAVIGSLNNTATFGALWDNTNLYIGVKVLDASLHANAVDYWNGDAVEVYIDANNNKAASYDGNDNQFIKAYNQTGVFSKVAISGLQQAWAPVTGGYTVEFAIPWSQLGISAPAAGTSIGFDIGNDDDDNGSGRSSQAVWNGTSDNYVNTSAFGKLTLNAGNASRVAYGDLFSSNVVTSIYPNPIINGMLTVAIVPAEATETAEISIINTTGVLVQKSIEKITDNQIQLNVAALNPGIYFLQINNGGTIITEKIIVQ